MMRNLILLTVAGITLVDAVPFGDKGGGAPPAPPFLPHGWGPDLGWGMGQGMGWQGSDRPAYDINPHFGFRQYSEMRYEPLTTPFTYSTQMSGPPAPQQPLAPIFKGEGAPYPNQMPGPVSVAGLSQGQAYGYGGNTIFDDGYLT